LGFEIELAMNIAGVVEAVETPQAEQRGSEETVWACICHIAVNLSPWEPLRKTDYDSDAHRASLCDKDKLSGVNYLKADDLPPEHRRLRRMLLGRPPPRATPAEIKDPARTLAAPSARSTATEWRQMKMDNDEDKAHRIADAIFMFALEDEDDDLTKEQADRLYERCLAEAYHMVVDEDYAALVRLGGATDVT
jgi:hypothetical protein